jgi:hypothetical protein
MNLIGRLYALLYYTRQYSFIFPLSMWIRGLPIVLLLFSLTRGWPLAVTLFWLALAVGVQWLYGKAGRDGYVRFVEEAGGGLPADLPPLPYNERVPLRATGVFSVTDRDEYVLNRPAEYWRVPLNDHIIMVQQRPGRFLYQFFQPDTLLEVRAGHLLFGTRPLIALAIRFQVNWGPEFGDDTRAFYVGGGQKEAPKKERWIYLSFEDETTRRQVWQTAVYSLAQAKQV